LPWKAPKPPRRHGCNWKKHRQTSSQRVERESDGYAADCSAADQGETIEEDEQVMPRPKKTTAKTPKAIASTQSLSAFVKSICDVMRRSNCASALQYVPELTWILFLRILDAQEARDAEEASALGADFSPALRSPYRWQDWAAPWSDKPGHPQTSGGKAQGWKRQALFAAGDGKLFDYINKELLPHLHGLDMDLRTGLPNQTATPKQRIVGRIMTAVEKVRVDSETNLLDILDRVHEISIDHIDDTHFFTLSQVYEDLLLKMGEKNSDGGQFFTPREVIRAMVHTVNPSLGQTVYDPCCGTGGFLAVAYEHIARKLGNVAASTDIETLKHDTFFGREKENLVFPIALANLVLHGIDQPNLWHGNSLTRRATYGALFQHAPAQFDVILTNPPFGGKEGKDAQKNFAFETSATQALFVQNILSELAPNGTCAIVLDEGLLFRTNESAFVETKRKLLDECDLWAIVSLPGGVFSTAGAGVKTNLLFFTKGRKTERIWYYDLSWMKVGKKTPLTLAHFGFGKDGAVLGDDVLPAALLAEWQADEANAGQPFPSYARLLASRSDSRYSWTEDFAACRAKAREEMRPLLDKAASIKAVVVDLKEELKRLKKDKAIEAKIEALEADIREREKSARDLEAEAAAIDAATFDLKAVNPNAVATVDERTPAQIIASIDAQGQIVTQALGRLKALLFG
jgi:type I restriction enzyme M protein